MNHEILKRVIYDQHETIRNAVIYDRDIELEDNANYVLVGLRRAGKSTLLYKRVQKLIAEGADWDQIIYINFDDERLLGFTTNDFDDILITAEEMFQGKHYFFFDEIQNIDNWAHFAIRIANQGLKVDITGSNAKMLSSEIGQQLGGRYIIKEVLPYSYKEYLRAHGVDKAYYATHKIAAINSIFDEYFTQGGLPETVLYKNKREYVSSVYSKVLYSDIVAHNSIRNENGLKLLIKKIAETVNNEISFTKLQNLITGIGYKISKDIVITYCNYCKDAFLIFELENYYASFLDKSSTPKYYFMDNGILNLFIDNKKSSLLENIVAIHLYRHFKDELYYLKGDKTDIDFYLSEKKVAIQVAYSIKDPDARKREIKNIVNLANSNTECDTFIIVTNNEEEEEEIVEKNYKIKVISIKNFLSKDNF